METSWLKKINTQYFKKQNIIDNYIRITSLSTNENLTYKACMTNFAISSLDQSIPLFRGGGDRKLKKKFQRPINEICPSPNTDKLTTVTIFQHPIDKFRDFFYNRWTKFEIYFLRPMDEKSDFFSSSDCRNSRFFSTIYWRNSRDFFLPRLTDKICDFYQRSIDEFHDIFLWFIHRICNFSSEKLTKFEIFLGYRWMKFVIFSPKDERTRLFLPLTIGDIGDIFL